jgi:alpha-glucosidase
MMLALPGVAYMYQGEELGLPEAMEIPDDKRQDPTFFRTAGKSYGRDGCRVPIPWEVDAHNYGFGPAGEPWLPQPAIYRDFARDLQVGDPSSTLSLYTSALAIRKDRALGDGELEWIEGTPENVLGFRNGDVSVFINYSEKDFALPAGEIILDSADSISGVLAPASTVWMI